MPAANRGTRAKRAGRLPPACRGGDVASKETEATGAAQNASPDVSSGQDESSGALGLTGKVLAGRYRVQSRLGAGGMATVYRAIDESLDRQVVIKVPHAALLVDPGFRKRFAKENLSLSRLEHPNIIPIYDVGEHDQIPFAVTRFLGGGDLSDRVKTAGGKLTPDQIMEWLPRIAETLDFVHERGWVHRDVSPGNIIFDEFGHAHLSDFGIATAVNADDPDATAQEYNNLTKPGGFVGAATYAPPESISRELNHAYDQYSLAVVVYEALCGDVPFPRGSSEAMLVAKNTQPPTPLAERAPELPTGLATSVMRALSKDPGKRFESSRAFTKAFGSAIAAAPGPAETAAARPESGTVVVDVSVHEKKSSMPWLALAAIVVAALAGAAWWLLGNPATSPLGEEPIGETRVADARPIAGTRIEFTVGSTAAEQRAAYALCEQVLGSACSATDYSDETVRVETIGPIELDRHEITNRQFADFASGGRYLTTAERQGFSFSPVAGGVLAKGTGLSWRAPTPDTGFRSRLDHPVVHVSQQDAAAYCEAQGKRLPTEAEWEYGARGDSRSTFPWGNDWSSERAVFASDETRPVGSKPEGSTDAGVADLAGNVWEWTSTAAPGDSGEVFVKGGGFADRDPAKLRGAMHMRTMPSDTSADVGFRCVRDL